MRRILLLLAFAAVAFAQPTPPALKRACTGSVTTNCTPQVNSGGSYVPPAGGSGTFNALTGDAASTSTGGATTVKGLNGQLLSALATCLLKNVTTTGVPVCGVAGTDYLTPAGSGAALTGITASQVGLGSVTNDAQTKAAVMPNTSPTQGYIPIGVNGGGSYAPVAMSQDCTITYTGVVTCTKTNNVSFSGLATLTETDGDIIFGSGGVWAKGTALPNGITATTQSAGDNSNKLATTQNLNTVYNLIQTSGSPYTMSALTGFYWNNTSSAYSWDLPTPVAGLQICVGNYQARATAQSLIPGSGVTIYFNGVAGTAGSATGLVSGGAAGDFICLEGTDSTTYMATGAGNGTWTNH